MAEYQSVLEYYGITNANPQAWPASRDGDYDEQEEEEQERQVTNGFSAVKKRQKSRYSILEQPSTRRSLVPGAQKMNEGPENLVQSDEADPLGARASVVEALRRKGMPVLQDISLRNQFLLSSKTFNSTMYLSQVQSDASTDDLLRGLDHLSRSIEQKTASLKVLVEANFERFVRAKSTIDDVYNEMRTQGLDPEPPKGHNRISSRGKGHIRNNSMFGSSSSAKNGFATPAQSDRGKHALTKETEYGVAGIKAPLTDVIVRAEEIWGPAIGGREREERLKAVLKGIEGAEEVLATGATVSECIDSRDYEGLAKAYDKIRDYVDAVSSLAVKTSTTGGGLTEQEVYRTVVIARVFLAAEEQVNGFKRVIWNDLTSIQANWAMSSDKSHRDDHHALISVLLALGVDDNPIWMWLISRYDYLKNKISSSIDHAKVEIEIQRRRLAQGERPTAYATGVHFKSPALSTEEGILKNLDSSTVTEMWNLVHQSLYNLLSPQSGVLGEVLDFWAKARGFIEGRTQRTLPLGHKEASKKHHRLTQDEMNMLRNGTTELLELVREKVASFFTEPPIEDISALYSPETGKFPSTPGSAMFQSFASVDARLQHDLTNPPPLTPKRGNAWEEYAFWPPYANSLSGVHYLERILALLSQAAGEMAGLRTGADVQKQLELLKAFVNNARERCTRAVCAAWANDAQSCKVLENWTRPSDDQLESKGLPFYFQAFEAYVLSGLQKIVYIPSAAEVKQEVMVVTPPPSKLLQFVKTQFVATLYSLFTSMVENAEKPLKLQDSLTSIIVDEPLPNVNAGEEQLIDISVKSRRMLLTLANLALLREKTVPALLTQCETEFSMQLTSEAMSLNSTLVEMDGRLFKAYTKPMIQRLNTAIVSGLKSPDFSFESRDIIPRNIRTYIHNALLLLVATHTEVYATSPSLLPRVLTHLLEQIYSIILSNLPLSSNLGPRTILQSTLDLEFLSQTMSTYSTPRASELQSEIYSKLDSKTSDDSRNMLKDGLGALKGILKAQRESSRVEFACFRKERGNTPVDERGRR